jgi:small subunit ribosomal protein S6
MRDYELVCIIHPELDETASNEVIERVKNWITESGGEIKKVDIWGKRRLAYPIRKQNEGQYVLFDVSLNPGFGSQLERSLRITEPVMRFLLAAK